MGLTRLPETFGDEILFGLSRVSSSFDLNELGGRPSEPSFPSSAFSGTAEWAELGCHNCPADCSFAVLFGKLRSANDILVSSNLFVTRLSRVCAVATFCSSRSSSRLFGREFPTVNFLILSARLGVSSRRELVELGLSGGSESPT